MANPGLREKELVNKLVFVYGVKEARASDIEIGRMPRDGEYVVRQLDLFALGINYLNFWGPLQYTPFKKWLIDNHLFDALSIELPGKPTRLPLDAVKIRVENKRIVDFRVAEIDGVQHQEVVRYANVNDPEKNFIRTLVDDYIREVLLESKLKRFPEGTDEDFFDYMRQPFNA